MGEYIFEIGGKEYKVEVVEITGKKATVQIGGKKAEVDIRQLGKPQVKRAVRKKRPTPRPQTTARARTEEPPPPKSSGKTVPIQAPIPGVILDILVSEGDSVSAGDDVILMEAMKMENRIQATRPGSVAKIHVRKEESVQQDDVLLEIEPS